MKRIATVLMIVAGLVLVSVPANAQMLRWTDRLFGSVNVSSQAKTSTDAGGSSTFALYGETGQATTTQTIANKGGTVFEVSAGARVIYNLGIGFTYVPSSQATGGASVSARVPHPLIYDQFRTGSSTVADLVHKEQVLHVFALYMIPISSRFDVAVFAGPTFFKLETDTISNPQFSEGSAPYTGISLTSATKTTTTKSKTAFNVGADVTVRIIRYIGVGGFVRYAKTNVEVTPGSGTAISIPIGGFQAGGGVRIRF